MGTKQSTPTDGVQVETPAEPTFSPVLGIDPHVTREALAEMTAKGERGQAEVRVALAFRMRIASDKAEDLAPIVRMSATTVRMYARQGATLVRLGDLAEQGYAAVAHVFNRYTSADARESVLGDLKDATPEQVLSAFQAADKGIDWAGKSGKAGNGAGQVTVTKDPHAALAHLDTLAGKIAGTKPETWGKVTQDDLRYVKSIRAHLTALSKVFADLPTAPVSVPEPGTLKATA